MDNWLTKENWGAVLSTVLAVVKIWEVLRSRRRLDYSYNFTGLEEVGNEVIIRNLSGTPAIITYWQLVWLKKKRFCAHKPERTIDADSDFREIVVASHSSATLHFSGENYFDWSAKSLAGASIYLRLNIAGERRPRLTKIYG